jgi:Uma2 family endonuclease
MKAAALVPVEEYLRTTYRPDRDYVDGEVLERNVGEKDHSRAQRQLIRYFCSKEHEWNAFCFPEQRVQVAPRRFRIPDVCLVLGKEPDEQIFNKPPFVCVEILSRDDTLESTQTKIDDYLNFGVAYVWVLNPRSRRAWIYRKGSIEEAQDGVLRTENPTLTVSLKDIFAGVDEA